MEMVPLSSTSSSELLYSNSDKHISVWNQQVRGEVGNRLLGWRLPLFVALAEITMVIASINASMSPLITLVLCNKSQTSCFRCTFVHQKNVSKLA